MRCTASNLLAVIDEIVVYEGRGVPAGAAGAIQGAIHSLRKQRMSLLSFAEDLALDVHHLQQAARRRDLVGVRLSGSIKAGLARKLWAAMATMPLVAASHT